ncbi:MAG: AAA family ATPase [Thermodesulfobacteriota bacterium]
MHFTSIVLENWRNFTRVDQRLTRRVILVGPNASGKSNFLDVFRFFRDLAVKGLSQAVNGRGGVSSLRALAARKRPNVVVECGLGSGQEEKWRYRLAVSQDNQRIPRVESEQVWRDNHQILNRPVDEDKEDPERLRQTYLEQVNANKDFREIPDFFSTVNYLHLVPQLIRDPDRSKGRQEDPFGGDFIERVAGKNKKTQSSWLRKIKEALKVAIPQLKDLEVRRDDVRGTPHLHGLYEHWRPHAGWQTEEQWSDGTLRLFGLLWSILDGTGPLLLEEPELSLHPFVVRHIPEMIARATRPAKGRQIIISTHSSDLLENPGIAADEILLFQPEKEGSKVLSGVQIEEVKRLLESGLSAAEAVIPRTKPRNADQLSLFGALKS